MIPKDSSLRCSTCHGVHVGHRCPMLPFTVPQPPLEKVEVSDDEMRKIVEDLIAGWKKTTDA